VVRPLGVLRRGLRPHPGHAPGLRLHRPATSHRRKPQRRGGLRSAPRSRPKPPQTHRITPSPRSACRGGPLHFLVFH
jgi:hypothetical protein